MKINERQLGQATVLDLVGKVDLQTSPAFRRVLLAALNGQSLVIVNLKQVDYVDSSGIAILVEAYRASKNLQKRFLLCGLAPMVRNLLELTHLARVFEIYETEEQALQAAPPVS
jgi:anti-sigma B factor antagonist